LFFYRPPGACLDDPDFGMQHCIPNNIHKKQALAGFEIRPVGAWYSGMGKLAVIPEAVVRPILRRRLPFAAGRLQTLDS
jgi:hypothetical protein